MACDDFTEGKGPRLIQCACGSRTFNKNGVCESCRVRCDGYGTDMDRAVAKFKAVKDSGVRESFASGAVRDTQDGKPRYDLIPVTALKRLAQHYANGSKKYGDRNWEKGIPASRCLASSLRHLYAYSLGETDEDHLSAVLFNVMAIIHWEETGRDELLDSSPRLLGSSRRGEWCREGVSDDPK